MTKETYEIEVPEGSELTIKPVASDKPLVLTKINKNKANESTGMGDGKVLLMEDHKRDA